MFRPQNSDCGIFFDQFHVCKHSPVLATAQYSALTWTDFGHWTSSKPIPGYFAIFYFVPFPNVSCFHVLVSICSEYIQTEQVVQRGPRRRTAVTLMKKLEHTEKLKMRILALWHFQFPLLQHLTIVLNLMYKLEIAEEHELCFKMWWNFYTVFIHLPPTLKFKISPQVLLWSTQYTFSP